MSRQPKRTTSTGIPRVAAEPLDLLERLGDARRSVGRRDDDLLAQERPAAALQQAELRVDLVGAVDRERQPQLAVELDDVEPGRAGELVGARRGDHDAQRAELVAPLAQQLGHGPDGAPRAEPDRGARLDERGGGTGRRGARGVGSVGPASEAISRAGAPDGRARVGHARPVGGVGLGGPGSGAGGRGSGTPGPPGPPGLGVCVRMLFCTQFRV